MVEHWPQEVKGSNPFFSEFSILINRNHIPQGSGSLWRNVKVKRKNDYPAELPWAKQVKYSQIGYLKNVWPACNPDSSMVSNIPCSSAAFRRSRPPRGRCRPRWPPSKTLEAFRTRPSCSRSNSPWPGRAPYRSCPGCWSGCCTPSTRSLMGHEYGWLLKLRNSSIVS